ncbi:homeodomain super [Entomophthora muscae]|uniref:Homeodomain super n=1 Tax=Entomophthora muscae TaxID=34485 RepID=A0ACC2TKQ1_9FUNG|nr:homeodomain super [Entomophthora muscae]
MDAYLQEIYRQWDSQLASITTPYSYEIERSSPDPEPVTPTQSSELSEWAAEHFPRRTRQNLPRESIKILKKWLFTHCENPYPEEHEKDELARQAKISATQLSNWFINARRRSLKRTIKDGARSFTITDMSMKPSTR